MLNIIIHNIVIHWHINIQWHFSLRFTSHVRLAITLACINRIGHNVIGNMAIWARRTKCHSPPYPYYYEK